MTETTATIAFEHGAFLRRVGALFVDAVIVTFLLQALALVGYPLTNGRLQFTGGFSLVYCEKRDAVPERVRLPADFATAKITDCRHGILGLTSSRVLSIVKPALPGSSTTPTLTLLLDARGEPVRGPTLDSLFLVILLGLRFGFDVLWRGTPGRKLCRLRLSNADDGCAATLRAASRRYAAQALPAFPAVIWMMVPWLAVDYAALGPNGAIVLQALVGGCLTIAALVALRSIHLGKAAWYDRFGGTAVLRLDREGWTVRGGGPASGAPLPDASEGSPDGATAAPPPRPRNYVLRHWHGDLSLPMSFWVNGLVLGFLVGIGINLSIAAVIRHAGDQPVPWLLALSVIWALVALIMIWQAVGIWRAAAAYAKSGGRFWGGAAKVAALLVIVRLVYDCAFIAAPQFVTVIEIALGDHRVGPHRIDLSADGDALAFSGGITFGVARELERVLDAAPGVRVVQLQSIGGRILEAQKISDLVRARGLTTFVPEECLSACTIVFLGGKERVLSPAGRLGFHQPAFVGITGAAQAAMVAQEEARLQRLGLSKAFAERANLITSSGMWYPTHDELVQEKVVTRIAESPWENQSKPVPSEPQAQAEPPPGTPMQSAPAGARTGTAIIPADVIKRLQAGK